MFLFGVMLLRLGAHDRGLEVVRGAVADGFTPVATLARHRAFDPVRRTPSFGLVQDEARRRTQAAQALFEAGGGAELLGLPAATRLN